MAKKSLVLSNDDGRVTFSNTSSVSIDDVTNNISASYISSSTVIFSNLTASNIRILSSSNGTLNNFANGTVASGAIAFNGTNWVISNLQPYDYVGTASGDVSGSYAVDVKVLNISNVSSGTLPVNYGGTGASITNGNYILKASSSSGVVSFSGLSGGSGSVLTCVDSKFYLLPPAYKPDVRFYTSGSSGNTFTWTKPVGAKFARIMMQGAGGGGGGGSSTAGAGGGGSGGFSDIILDITNIASASIIVGLGGNGGPGGGSGVGGNGVAGATTYFIVENYPSTTFYAGGGGAGGWGGGTSASRAANGGIAGVGMTKNGGRGGASTTAAPETVYSMPSGGGSQSFGAGTIIPLIQNKNFGYSISSDGISISIIDASGSTYNSQSRPSYGAGGGGSAANTAGAPGGHGYVLIISW